MNNLKCLILILFLFSSVSCQKLIMVQQLFRHGARYPVYPKNDDDSNYTFAEHSFGQLTTNGKKMHYLLGGKIYNLYWESLFKDTKYYGQYNQSKFYIKSTDVNRTIQSVQSHMMGILQNLPQLNLTQNMVQYSLPQWPDVRAQAGIVFPKAQTFHPIAIHVQKTGTQPFNQGDFLRTYSPQNCPTQDKWMIQNRQSKRVIQITKDRNFTLAIQALSKAVNKNLTFYQSAAYYDNYQSAKYMGRQYLSIFQHPLYEHPLNYIHTLDMYINLYMNPKQIRATATGFFNQTVRNMKKIISNKQEVQWNIYSAHDTTVGNMLAAMNMTNIQCIYEGFLNNVTKNTDTCVVNYPLYTSNIIFQLYQHTNKTHFIKVRYNGEHRKMPFCDYKLECPVQQFYAWYDGFKDQSWLVTCGVEDPLKQMYFGIAVAQFGILLTLAIAVAIKYLKQKMKTKNNTNNGSNRQVINNNNIKSHQTPNQMITESLLSAQKGSSLKEQQ